MRRVYCCLIMFVVFQLVMGVAWASKEDCGKEPNVPPKPEKEVNKEDPNVNNDYDQVVKEDTRPGVVYLAVIGGSQPKPNACGLNPSNPSGEWTGWGGPLNADNMTIGEGVGTRNRIVIGGIFFERGVGTHAEAKLVYPLTGDKYVKFEAYVGLSDEKDAGLECGHGGSCEFIFSIDGKEVFKSGRLVGGEAGKNTPALKVEFDIPSGSKELLIQITGAGDGISCDHGALGDAKLLTSRAMPVEPIGKMTTLWGKIKASY